MKHQFYKCNQFYRNILTYKIYKTTNIRHLLLQVEKRIEKFLSWQSNIFNNINNQLDAKMTVY